jgi:anti-sigma factor RsiW
MICSEARQYLFAFLDNELDAALSLEVQQHLEHCPLCARECEIERVIRKQLGHTLQITAAADPSDTDKELQETIHTVFGFRANVPAAPGRRRKLARSAGAVALLGITIAVFLGWPANEPASGQFVDLLVNDFQHFQDKGRPLQIESSEPKAVSDWLIEQTALAVRLPALPEADGRLLGARKCKIDGKPAAFAVYELDQRIASLVVVQGSDHDLESMERVEDAGHTHWLDRCKGHTVLACRRGALVYAAVSTLPEDQLLPLMANTED